MCKPIYMKVSRFELIRAECFLGLRKVVVRSIIFLLE